MNPQIRRDHAFESWLDDGPTRMPEHLVEAIVIQLEETHQRRHLWLPGREQMNRMMVAVGGVAAVILVAVLGIYFAGPAGGIGSNDSASATPLASPSARSLPTGGGPLDEGQYFVDLSGYRYAFTIPAAGWASAPLGSEVAELTKSNTPVGVYLWGGVDASQAVWREACQWSGTSFTPGPSADEMASALASLAGFTTAGSMPLTFNGNAGARVALTVPSDVDTTKCRQGQYRSWDGRFYNGPAQTDDVRVFDLAGGSRHMFFTSYFANTTAMTRTEQDQIVQSLTAEQAPMPLATSAP